MDDIISRQAAMCDLISGSDAICAILDLYPDRPVIDFCGARRKWAEKYKPYIEAEKAIRRLPSAQPELIEKSSIYQRI